MKYKITLGGKTYEVEVDEEKAMLVDEYEALCPRRTCSRCRARACRCARCRSRRSPRCRARARRVPRCR